MKHLFIDEHSNLDSALHRLDPRTKIITFLVFIFFIVLTHPELFLQFSLYLLLLLSLIFLSKVPLIYVLKKSLVIIPFVILVSLFIPFIKEGELGGGYSLGNISLNITYSGIMVFWNICIKSFLSVICLILLSSTTSFPHFLKGLEELRFPRIIIMVLSFMYRYLFVTVDELMRMRQAKDSRTIRPRRFFELKTLANLLGNLFIRSYDRGERIYLAMCSRGFNGRIKTLKRDSFKYNDIIFAFGLVLLLVIIRLMRP